MTNVAIITVAGTSTRFRKSINKDCLKCIYTESSPEDALIMRQLSMCKDFDKIIIVGGYKFEELKAFINANIDQLLDKIILVENSHYEDLGSGYSLICGILEAEKINANTITFLEGDLFLDSISFDKIKNSKKNVITTNNDPIEAKKAVAFYSDAQGFIHYKYDTSHELLSINEPFLGIYNSGQVWKFTDTHKLFDLTKKLTQDEISGTNLVLVQKYFGNLNNEQYEIINFNNWINCNTVEDYRKAEAIK